MQYAFEFETPRDPPAMRIRPVVPRGAWKEPAQNGQSCLPGLGRVRLDCISFMLLPDEAAKRHVGQEVLPCLHVPRDARFTRNLHVSVLGIGGYDGVPRALVRRLQDAMAEFRFPPFEVVFDRAMWFRDARTVVLVGDEASQPVNAFRRALLDELRGAGMRLRATSTIIPHMTLFRCDQSFEPRRVPPVNFRIDVHYLIDSLRGQGRHVVLGRWPLDA